MNDISDYALTDLVWKNSGLGGSAKLIAIGLARAFDSRQGYSRYPLDYLAKDTGLSRPTVISALKEIEESGEWSLTRQSGPRGTRYYPNLEILTQPQPRRKAKKTEGTPAKESSPVPESKPKPEVAQKPAKPKPRLTQASKKHFNYPETEENTDPMLDSSLPIYAEDDTTEILNPPLMKSSLAAAVRLHRRTDIRTRVKPHEFTVPKVQSIYDELMGRGYPMEAVDILLWLQCDRRQPLNIKFLSTVLGMCTNDGRIVEPVRWDSDKPNPAYTLARHVYQVHQLRQKGSQYVEAL